MHCVIASLSVTRARALSACLQHRVGRAALLDFELFLPSPSPNKVAHLLHIYLEDTQVGHERCRWSRVSAESWSASRLCGSQKSGTMSALRSIPIGLSLIDNLRTGRANSRSACSDKLLADDCLTHRCRGPPCATECKSDNAYHRVRVPHFIPSNTLFMQWRIGSVLLVSPLR